MKKLLILIAALSAFAGCLRGGQHFKHEFDSLKGWQVREGVEATLKDGWVSVKNRGLFFTCAGEDPGARYTVNVVGEGKGEVKVGDKIFKLDFSKDGKFSRDFQLGYSARAYMWIGFNPEEGTVLRLKSVEIIPLPDPAGRVRLERKALSRSRPSPKKVRAVSAGALDRQKADFIKSYKASAVVVSFAGAGDADALARQVDAALEAGLRPIIKLVKSKDPAADMKAAKAALGGRLEKVYAFIPAKYGENRDKFNALVKRLRADFPNSWFVYVANPGDYPTLNPIADLKIIYAAHYTYKERAKLAAIPVFQNIVPAPFMAIGPTPMPEEFEQWHVSWILESSPQNLEKNIARMERPLHKGGTKQEQLECLKKTFLKNKQDGDFSFAFATDTHYQSNPDKTQLYATSADHMREMAKVAKELKLAFVANGGDMVRGVSMKEESLKDIREIVGAMEESGLPVFVSIGNHDDGVFWALKTFPKSDLSQVVTGAEWHDACAPAALKKGAVGDKNFDKANYCYMDFPEAKIRLINLAVSENPMTINEKGKFAIDSCGLYDLTQRQLDWLTTQALNFSDKPDAKDWAVIFMSHCRMGKITLFPEIVKAFIKGGSFSGERGAGERFPAKVSCDFSKQGPIPVIMSIAGHFHSDDIVYSPLGYVCPVLLNDCNRSTKPSIDRVRGEANDAAWTIVTVNRKNNAATYLRFGAGADMKSFLIKPNKK